jgi:outer membrane protein assembly factor BamB
MNTKATFFVVACLTTSATLWAGNWPQWRGADRTDISRETGLLKQWPEGGPKRLWLYKDAGLGFAGFSVVGQMLYTMGARNDTEMLIALDVKDGSEKWTAPIGPMLTNDWGYGPRGTPTVNGDFIYALSGKGELVCAKAADGSIVWKASMKELGGGIPGWGYTESPLVDGDKVLCTPGGKQGAIAALDKHTGKVIWQSKDFTEGAQYSSIVPADINGKHQYIQLTMHKLVGVDAETGNVLWTSDWPGKTAVIPTPIVKDNFVYITSGYGAGCKLVQIGSDSKATDVYESKLMENHHGGVVLVGDYLYGYSNKSGWVCQEFKTGKEVWANKKGLGKGCLTCADGMLYLMGEADGQVVLIEASPEGWKEHGRFSLQAQTTLRRPKGKIWTHPVIADGKMYLRDQELISCYDVRGN